MKLKEILKPYVNGEIITLWHICPLNAWRHFQTTGSIKGDGRRLCYGKYRESYTWMIQQMAEKIPGHKPGQFPVWAWYHPRPDLRHTAHLPKKIDGVLLKCQVPSSRVLLSDFCAWHHVLNQWYLALNLKEANAWEAEESKLLHQGNMPAYWEARIKKARASWLRIFDLSAINHSQYLGRVDRIQATTSFIKVEEVVKVIPFKAR